MTKPRIIEEEPINMVELKDEIEKILKRDKELSFRANKTHEYLNSIVILKTKESKELADKLMKLKIPRLKELHINKIIEILPGSVEEVKTIIQAYTITISPDNIKKIVNTVSGYIKKE